MAQEDRFTKYKKFLEEAQEKANNSELTLNSGLTFETFDEIKEEGMKELSDLIPPTLTFDQLIKEHNVNDEVFIEGFQYLIKKNPEYKDLPFLDLMDKCMTDLDTIMYMHNLEIARKNEKWERDHHKQFICYEKKTTSELLKETLNELYDSDKSI